MSTFVENCLRLFEVGMNYDTDYETLLAINSLSIMEKAYLTRELLPGLVHFYKDWVMQSSQEDTINVKAYALLVNAVENANDFSREDFIYFLDNADLYTLKFVVLNPHFPVDLMINNPSFTRSEKFFYSSFRSAFNSAMRNRHADIVAYCRSVISNSESMTDEMVLNVAGVTR